MEDRHRQRTEAAAVASREDLSPRILPLAQSETAVRTASALAGGGPLPLDALRWEAVRRLHETSARGLAEGLSLQLHHPVEVRLADLAASTTAKLLLSRRPPTCFAVLAAQPLNCRLLLEIEPAVLYPLFDWLLGGGSEPSCPPNRPMTEMELLMAERIIPWITLPYAAAWEHVLSLELSLERLEHNPLRLRHLPALAPVVLASWSVHIGTSLGRVCLAVPQSAIALMADKLAAGASPPHIAASGGRLGEGTLPA